MTFEPHQTAPQLPVSNSLHVNSSASGWISRVTRRLSLSQKIGCGYAFALSVTIIGTVAGFAIGDYYQQPAIKLREQSEEEIRLLDRLQNGVLQARSHQQQFIPLTQNPELLQKEYTHFLGHAAEIKRVFSEIKSYANRVPYKNEGRTDRIPPFIKTYENVPETYFRQVEELIRQIDPPHLKSAEIEKAQKILLNFTNGSVALKFDDLSDDLTEVINASYLEAKQANAAFKTAAEIRVQIIATSILLSVVTAILLAIYTSRAIARPIIATTKVAQQVTQEANFDLQAPVTTSDEVGMLATSLNQLIQQVKHLLEEQQADAQAQLMQSEKMSSLGQMLAGVAHEINNPVNFIYGNIVHASDYFEEILALLDTYATEIPNPPLAVQVQAEEMDIDFLKEDLLKVLQSMKVGAERVRQIVLSLKDFSRLDEGEAHSVDLHACIDSTLLILNSRIKKGINVVHRYGDIPTIEGFTGLLYQVFMNLLSNAIDALEEKAPSSSPKEIVISTEQPDKDWVVVRIADNGSGIPAENQAKIFDYFFTTKPRGVGTGLGLAISHHIVVEKHGGKLTCQSEPGKGTEFAIALPIKNCPGCQTINSNSLLLARC